MCGKGAQVENEREKFGNAGSHPAKTDSSQSAIAAFVTPVHFLFCQICNVLSNQVNVAQVNTLQATRTYQLRQSKLKPLYQYLLTYSSSLVSKREIRQEELVRATASRRRGIIKPIMSFEIKRARGKTAVFAGTRQHCDYVPRLEDLCIQKLMDNANKIECVGDVPYYILRPLLTKISLPQLRRIESFNPQLVDEPESDEPWKAHCLRHFDNRRPGRDETWRELFARCEEERETKIEKIAKRIKKHEEKAAPQSKAKFVDHQLAGGRNRAISSATIIKKTIKNHIPLKGHVSASSSSNGHHPTTSTIVIKREVNASNGSSSTKTTKQKAAPLMQKSMQLFKSRFRR